MCTLSVSYVIYHKFSHGAAFYSLNGKNVNVMLESFFFPIINTPPLPCKQVCSKMFFAVFPFTVVEREQHVCATAPENVLHLLDVL